ncbi:MAG: DegT/DnrJ/EryC1/StrS family aminotransferase [Pseudotabrizicola sp.]|uniref:DegT/DnrJ/EryC1/StrS family aminotransferase n=1 Tax=Pseudotabrizicola sp. TaxID=2939647 RepID=UPI00272354CC|nr:DegT/DnrJ/EryC1/StrS family aminotransferase [Pseudotabrizicola sp.]MDO8884117.1 DegT/DnrJ/EryC1/StrS family aminotransferase [Pseudotabrizicola sp.]MDP2083034.1 DegT/DnrJ/EryC1/StrS family aminotransferase [Pseudotabrizicola sp.]MDZ7572452.1 DegT/DnrJ/EryC1/StrS family aminotransferase [Pseudotabrizicola sp.]
MERFTGSFTQQEPIPEEGIAAALDILRHGRLHRYNTAAGEVSPTALLEQEFAEFTGARYCLAVASGGYAMATALRAVQVCPGAPVLTNAFTLAPVPGAIASIGARPVFIETTRDLTIDFPHLEQMARATGAQVLVLSHMRGHLCDMDRLMTLCNSLGVRVIEDCAHTMGAAWNGVPSGRHGVIGCYSTQTYKHMNSGEGGFLVTDDAGLAARSVLLSGSYMLYERHLAAPPPEVFEALRLDVPNVSGRMDNLRAAILRPQIALLPDRAARWTALYRVMERGLDQTNGLRLIPRPEPEAFVPSSFQFTLPGWDPGRVAALVARCAARGVELKWFGAPDPVGFTSRYEHWRYASPQSLPQTDAVLAGLIDLRLPLTFSPEDVALIARIIRAEVLAVGQGEIERVTLGQMGD